MCRQHPTLVDAVARAAGLVQSGIQRDEFHVQFAVGRQQIRKIGIAVEYRAVGFAPQQRLVFMLSMDIDESVAQRTQIGYLCRAVVDKRPARTLCGYLPPQNQHRLPFRSRSFDVCVQMFQRRGIEFRLDHRFVAPLPHHGRVRSFAQHQAQCIDDDRFPRSCFACHDSQTRREPDADFFYQSKIANVQRCEHTECAMVNLLLGIAGTPLFPINQDNLGAEVMSCNRQ